jgi:hypothetical protein
VIEWGIDHLDLTTADRCTIEKEVARRSGIVDLGWGKLTDDWREFGEEIGSRLHGFD